MARLSYEQLELLKEKYGVKKIWSYSRWNSFFEHPWIYRMHYLEGVKSEDSIYTHFGTISHTIMEDFYEGKIEYEDMIKVFKKEAVDWKKNSSLKFMSENVEIGYIRNLVDYFGNTEVIPYEVEVEKPVVIKMRDEENDKNVLFVGYADGVYRDTDNDLTYILDFKTSSKSGFSGKGLVEKSRQLKLYAIGIHQMTGVPYEELRCRFDMQKYYEVWHHSENAKGETKISKSKQERMNWVSAMTKKLSKDLAKLDYDPFEVDEMVEECVQNNNLKTLPEEVQNKYELHNCYIDVGITEEEAEEMMKMMVSVCNEAEEKEKLDWDASFPEPKILGTNDQFFYETLNAHLLPYAKEYQRNLAMLKGRVEDTDDLLALFED